MSLSTWELIKQEIDEGRPPILGYFPYPIVGEGVHATVCVGYGIENEINYVYVSDALANEFRKIRFDLSYTDRLITIDIVEEG